MYQIIEENDNKDNIMVLFNSKLMRFILKLTQYSESPNHKNEFKILNMITKPNEGVIKTEEDLYKFYGINEKEQELIEKISGYEKKSKKSNNSSNSSNTKKNIVISEVDASNETKDEIEDKQEEKVDELVENTILSHNTDEELWNKELNDLLKEDELNLQNTEKDSKEKNTKQKKKIRRKINVVNNSSEDELYDNTVIDLKYQQKFDDCKREGKLWNNNTHRCVSNNTLNRKKIKSINNLNKTMKNK